MGRKWTPDKTTTYWWVDTLKRRVCPVKVVSLWDMKPVKIQLAYRNGLLAETVQLSVLHKTKLSAFKALFKHLQKRHKALTQKLKDTEEELCAANRAIHKMERGT